jgi:uncharacterized membrane protein YeaQ/YmgE (transglycosylase-associated protein family)
MFSALLLGLVCGALARVIVPNDAFRHLRGPKSWGASMALGLIGAVVGYLLFTRILGLGDTEIFDFGVGALLSALIGSVIVVWAATLFAGRNRRR